MWLTCCCVFPLLLPRPQPLPAPMILPNLQTGVVQREREVPTELVHRGDVLKVSGTVFARWPAANIRAWLRNAFVSPEREKAL